MAEQIGVSATWDNGDFAPGYKAYLQALKIASEETKKFAALAREGANDKTLAAALARQGEEYQRAGQKRVRIEKDTGDATAKARKSTLDAIARIERDNALERQEGLKRTLGEIARVNAAEEVGIARARALADENLKLSESYTGSSKQAEILGRASGALIARMEQQQARLETLRVELARISTQYGEASTQARNKQIQIERLTNSLKQGEQTLQRYGSRLQGLPGFLQQATSFMGAFLKGVTGLTVGLAAIEVVNKLGEAFTAGAKRAFEAVSYYEQLGFALETLVAREIAAEDSTLTYAEALERARIPAENLRLEIQQLAIQSPFTQKQVAEAVRLAQAYGFVSDEALRLTEAVVNFGAGAGISGEQIDRVILALGQIRTRGKLAGEEVRQLTEAGVPVLQILAEAFGTTTSEVTKLQEKGLIPANKAIEAIVSTLERDFEGAAKRQTETLQGLLSTFNDLLDINFQKFAQGFFDAIRPVAIQLTELFGSESFQNSIQKTGEEIGRVTGEVIKLIDAMGKLRQLGAPGETSAPIEFGTGRPTAGSIEAAEQAGGARGFLARLMVTDEEAARFRKQTEETAKQLLVVNRAADAADAVFNDLATSEEKHAALMVLLTQGRDAYIEKIRENSDVNRTYLEEARQVAEALGLIAERTNVGAAEVEKYVQRTLDLIRVLGPYLAKERERYAILEAIRRLNRSGPINDQEIRTQPDEGLNQLYAERLTLTQKVNEATQDYLEEADRLTQERAESDKEYNEQFADLTADRQKLDQEFARERLDIYNKLNKDLSDLARDNAKELADIARDRAEADKDYAEGRREAEDDLNRSISDLEREHNEELRDIASDRVRLDKDLAKEREEAYRDFLQAKEDLERQHSRTLEDIERSRSRENEDFARTEANRLEDYLERQGELRQAYSDKVDDLEESIDERRAAFAEDERERELKLIKDIEDARERSAEKQKQLTRDLEDFLAPFSEFTRARLEAGADPLALLGRERGRRYQELTEGLRDERESLDDRIRQLEDDAAKEKKLNEGKHNDAILDLQERLEEEKVKYQKALDDLKEKFDEETEASRIRHERALADLELRLARELEDFALHNEALQRKLDEQLADLQDAYNDAIQKLQDRFAQENAEYDRNRQDILAKYAERIADLDAHYAEQVQALRDRFAEEQAEYALQRGELLANYATEQADLAASYATRVDTIRQKLDEIALEHAQTQIELRDQQNQTRNAFLAQVNELTGGGNPGNGRYRGLANRVWALCPRGLPSDSRHSASA